MEEEKFFNINSILKNVFDTLDQSCQSRTPNLVFNFSKHVPCQMKGDVTTLYSLLFKMMAFVLQYKCDRELLLTVDAPEEFLYKEDVTFTLTQMSIKKEKIASKLETLLAKDLEQLNTSLQYSDANGGSLSFSICLTTAELGCRRHYRLPSKEYLNKNILLVIEGHNLALSLTRMFSYFPMNIDISLKRYKDKFDLSEYDLVIVEDSIFDFFIQDAMKKAQVKSPVTFALLGNSDIYTDDDSSKLHTEFLQKPVTQENVYELLLKVFDDLPILA